MTLTSPTSAASEIERQSLPNRGGEPPIVLVYSFKAAMSNTIAYALFTDERFDDMATSEFVKDPVLLYREPMGLTGAGKVFMGKYSTNAEIRKMILEGIWHQGANGTYVAEISELQGSGFTSGLTVTLISGKSVDFGKEGTRDIDGEDVCGWRYTDTDGKKYLIIND